MDTTEGEQAPVTQSLIDSYITAKPAPPASPVSQSALQLVGGAVRCLVLV